ncbi:hypothetical protein [Hydrogenimonas sp.]
MHNKSPAFTLLEVLISIMLLFTMGLALLKFDSWTKREIKRYSGKAILLYRSTPLLYANLHRIEKRDITLYDTTRFAKLRDDEIFWLKNLEAKAALGKEEKKTLFQSGDLDLTYKLFPVRIQQNGDWVNFLRIEP